MAPIIDNYRDLPLGAYIDLLDRIDGMEDELASQCAIISALTGLTEKEVLNLPLEDYKQYAASAQFLRTDCPEDLIRIADTYPCGQFQLHPVKDYTKLTVAQYVDFQTFAKEPDKRLVELLSVLLVPDGCKYGEGYDIAEVQTAIRNDLNVADALGLAAHFFAFASGSMQTTLTYSRRLARRMKDGTEKTELLTKIAEATRTLYGSGDGSQPSMKSQNSRGRRGRTSGR